jgi:hypothetical protein
MSPPPEFAAPAGRDLPADARIKVKGHVHLGRTLRLHQADRPSLATGFHFSTGLPEDGTLSPLDRLGPVAVPGQLPVQELSWTLDEVDGDQYIEHDGLVASYGIFGAPRSGKTHLLMHLFRQLMALHADDADRRFGGIVVDPKAALIKEVADTMEAAGRRDDLVVLNPAELVRLDAPVNVIDAGLSPDELGRVLILAAQSAGVGASEPFWFGAWKNLFTAALPVLDWVGLEVTSLASLMETVLVVEPSGEGGTPERRIQRIARDARLRLDELDAGRRRDMTMALDQIDGFYRQEADNVATVESLMTTAYGGFRQSAWLPFSARMLKVPGQRRTTFYDQIIDDGKVVLVSIAPSEAGMAKVLCTLIKVLFQRTLLSRLERVRLGSLRNFERPVLFLCDEYSDVASEVPGEPAGDGYFFSLCRQFGCMGLVATQSVNMLQASSLNENWKSVFSNFAAKVFMRLGDNETAEEANKLAGESDWYVTSAGTSQQKDGTGSSSNTELRERKALPTAILTEVIARRQAAVIGSLDGGDDPGLWFVRVPDEDEAIPGG